MRKTEPRKHTAELPDGTTVTRNSKNHTYAYAVAVYSVIRGDTEPTWGVLNWCSRMDLARKAARNAELWLTLPEYWQGEAPRIVPVTVA